MSSIRRCVYVALLGAASLNSMPSLASGQEAAHGKFRLTHDVHFGNAAIPAGEYSFSYDPNGVSPVLVLSKLSGTRAGFMVLVPAVTDSKASDDSKLLLASTPEGSYVSTMQLPQSGMTLHFNVPSRVAEKQMANAVRPAPTGQ